MTTIYFMLCSIYIFIILYYIICSFFPVHNNIIAMIYNTRVWLFSSRCLDRWNVRFTHGHNNNMRLFYYIILYYMVMVTGVRCRYMVAANTRTCGNRNKIRYIGYLGSETYRPSRALLYGRTRNIIVINARIIIYRFLRVIQYQ